jgi:hypothetical protein
VFTLILAAVLSQAPAVAPTAPVVAPVQAATVPAVAPAALTPEAAAAQEGKKVAKNYDRTGCVEQTGSRIKRRDKATCNNGRSISQEDIERAGGSIVPYSSPAIPAAAGN